MPFNIGPGELILILIIALIVVGPGKLPDVGAAIGKSLREFRHAASDVSEVASTQAPAIASAPRSAVTPNELTTSAAPNQLSNPPRQPGPANDSTPS